MDAIVLGVTDEFSSFGDITSAIHPARITRLISLRAPVKQHAPRRDPKSRQRVDEVASFGGRHVAQRTPEEGVVKRDEACTRDAVSAVRERAPKGAPLIRASGRQAGELGILWVVFGISHGIEYIP